MRSVNGFMVIDGGKSNKRGNARPEMDDRAGNKNSPEASGKIRNGKPVGTKIEDLEMSARTYLGLKAAGIETIEELQGITDEEMLKIPHFSQFCVDDIKKVLAEYNRSL